VTCWATSTARESSSSRPPRRGAELVVFPELNLSRYLDEPLALPATDEGLHSQTRAPTEVRSRAAEGQQTPEIEAEQSCANRVPEARRPASIERLRVNRRFSGTSLSRRRSRVRVPSLPPLKVPANKYVALSYQTRLWPNPVAQTSGTKHLEIAIFCGHARVRPHEQNGSGDEQVGLANSSRSREPPGGEHKPGEKHAPDTTLVKRLHGDRSPRRRGRTVLSRRRSRFRVPSVRNPCTDAIVLSHPRTSRALGAANGQKWDARKPSIGVNADANLPGS